MIGKPSANGSRVGARSGTQALILLATPLNASLLRSLAGGARQQSDLLGSTGAPAKTTLRTQLKRLTAAGAIERHRRDRFPGAFEYELTAAGRDLLFVLGLLEEWLEAGEGEPPAIGTRSATAAIKALAEGWSTSVVPTIAARPFSLTELDARIPSLSYPALERRLAALRLNRLVEVDRSASHGRGTPYAATTWLRRAVAPLLAASRWERRHALTRTTSMCASDVEAALLLAAPLLRPPAGASGRVRLGVETSDGGLGGVAVEASERIVSCTPKLNGNMDAWALGPPGAWPDALIGGDLAGLELGGDYRLARDLLTALGQALGRRTEMSIRP